MQRFSHLLPILAGFLITTAYADDVTRKAFTNTTDTIQFGANVSKTVTTNATGSVQTTTSRLVQPDTRIIGCSTGAWVNRSSLPVPLQEVALTVSNNKLYAFGGSSDVALSAQTNNVYEWTPSTNTWALKTKLPVAIGNASAMSVTSAIGKIYVLGGKTGTSTSKNTAQQYDPVANTWTAITNLPATLHGAAAVSTFEGGKIFLLGGMNGTTPTNTVYVYNTSAANNAWVAKTNMPAALAWHSASFYKGKIYVIGGQTAAGGYSSAVYAYDVENDSWTTKTALSVGLRKHGSHTLHNRVYITNGETSVGESNRMYVYNAHTDTWENTTGMTTPWAGKNVASVMYRKNLFLLGGSKVDNIYNNFVELCN
jgi:N-acetylneuraminic acid mutarotase